MPNLSLMYENSFSILLIIGNIIPGIIEGALNPPENRYDSGV